MLRYRGLLLKRFCFLHSISFNSILYAVRHKGYSLEEAVKLAMKDELLSDKIVLRYKGKSLRQYCKEHGIGYDTIRRRLKDDPKLTVKKAVESYHLIKVKNKYDIDGVSLRKYCAKHNIKYANVMYLISKKFYNVEDAIKAVVEGKTRYTYWYKGVPLVKYCRENGIRYNGVIQIINLEERSVDDAVEEYLKRRKKI